MNQDEINIFLNGHVFNEQSKMAIETFETSGIDFSLLNKMGIGLFSGKEEKLKERLGYADLGRNPLLTACILIQFPHFDHQNNINYYSFKPIPAIEGRKYLLPKGTTPVPYIMPSTWEVKNKTNEPLWITEGIKKALKLSQHQRFSISISGVWNFKSSKSPDETFWLQEFEHFSWHGRHVFLGFDADLWTNPSVRYALYELGFKLLANGAIVKLPQWKNGKGVDDYLVSQENPEAALKGLEEDAALLNTFCRAEHANEVIRAVANSGLSGIAYEQSCRVLAKKLNVTPSSLKHEIENHIKRQRKDNIANSDDEITREFGQPFYIKDKGVDSLNESYWAAENYFEYIELFEPSENEFYRYEEQSGLFINISENTIKQEVSKNILKMSREIDSASLEAQRTNQNLNAIISQLRGIALKHDAFDKNNRKFVHVENGVLELDEKGGFSLKPFSPEYRSRNKNPIIFDKNAKCDRFLNELLTPAVKPGDIRVIQKYFGQCLLGNNVSQRFLILDGNAGTGKSTLAVVMQKLIGVENVTQLRTKHLAERFELFRFLKKTLLVGVDVPGDFLSEKSAQVIKGLVGGDILTAEKKGGNGTFELFGNFNLIITSNSRLQVRLDGDLGAWKRRLMIVRYEQQAPVKKIPNLADKLIQEEGSGILNWGLEGLQMLFDDIHHFGDIEFTCEQTKTVDALLAESDSVRHFLVKSIKNNNDADLTTTEIVEAYAEFCPKNGWNAKPITNVYHELEKLMLELFRTTKAHDIKREGKNHRGYRRIGWVSDASDGYFKPSRTRENNFNGGENKINLQKPNKDFELSVRSVRDEVDSKLLEGAI